MLYFQLVIMAGTVMLAYYFEYTDTFSVHVQGFFCYDTAYTKPYLGPEDSSAVPPVLLYAVVAGLPTLLVSLRPPHPLSAQRRASRPSRQPTAQGSFPRHLSLPIACKKITKKTTESLGNMRKVRRS